MRLYLGKQGEFLMPNFDPLHEEVEKQEEIFKGRYLHVKRLEIKLPNGSRCIREVVAVRNAVAVLPIDADRKARLVRQHRPAIGRSIIEVPAGLIDPGESEEDAALRECEEETGLRPGKLQRLITYAHAEGYSTGFITLFLATDLTDTGKTCFDETENMEQVTMDFNDLLALIRRNQILDSKTMLCALLSKDLLN